MPASANDAVVASALASANATVPGPDNVVHVAVSAPGGFGRPSSLAVPASEAVAGKVIDCAGPAFTTGATLAGEGGVCRRRSASNRRYRFTVSCCQNTATRSASAGASPSGSVTAGATPAQSPTLPSRATVAAHTSPETANTTASTKSPVCCG